MDSVQNPPSFEELQIASGIYERGESLVQAYITQDKETGQYTLTDELPSPTNASPESNEFHGNVYEILRSIEGSSQSGAELNQDDRNTLMDDRIEPPYCPDVLGTFLELDETHTSCCKVKSIDSTCRGFELRPNYQVVDKGEQKPSSGKFLTPETHQKELDEIKEFLCTCNPHGFEDVCYRVGLDRQAIGYGAMEVIRRRNGKVCGLKHLPARRIKVIRNWKGFLEVDDNDENKTTWYQNFGEKVLSSRDILGQNVVHYDPKLDGELNLLTNADGLKTNYIDRKTGKPTTDFDKSANEIIWMPVAHIKTVYYGVPDCIPVVSSIVANLNIENYQLQYYEHNTVPRFAVIVHGAKLAPEVTDHILKFFNTEIKGQAHKTLVLAIPGFKNEVSVEFKPLDTAQKEDSFMESYKENRQKIMTAHGVSPAIIGIHESASMGSGKGLAQAEIYKDRVITPLQKTWEKVLNRLFILGLGLDGISISFSPLDIRDLISAKDIYLGYLEKAVISINEVRKFASLGDPIENGDHHVFFTPGGIVPLETLPLMIERAKQMPEEMLGLQVDLDKDSAEKANRRKGDMARFDATSRVIGASGARPGS